jgi:branched-subunit amino acid aminotransferase/4-amino-4-deoxychorismate lyase
MTLPLYVSRNGILIPPAQASVSVFNPAVYGAYGVYESMQVVQGWAFEETAHLQRLVHSAEILGLSLPADLTTIGRWIGEVLAANGAADCTLRLFVVGPDNGGDIVAYLWPQPLPVYPPEYYTEGAKALTFEGCRYLPQAKSLNSLVSYLAQRQARMAGVHEGLLHHNGYLTEGSNSNLFVVQDGVILTPPAREVLAGVTRDMVIALAGSNGIPLVEASPPVTESSRWEECFITSTSRHVMPITVIDGRPVGNRQVGPMTRRLMTLFASSFAEKTTLAGA